MVYKTLILVGILNPHEILENTRYHIKLGKFGLISQILGKFGTISPNWVNLGQSAQIGKIWANQSKLGKLGLISPNCAGLFSPN